MIPSGRIRPYSSRKAPVEPYKSFSIKLSNDEYIILLKKAVDAGLAVKEYIRLKALHDDSIKDVLLKNKRKIQVIPPNKTEAP